MFFTLLLACYIINGVQSLDTVEVDDITIGPNNCASSNTTINSYFYFKFDLTVSNWSAPSNFLQILTVGDVDGDVGIRLRYREIIETANNQEYLFIKLGDTAYSALNRKFKVGEDNGITTNHEIYVTPTLFNWKMDDELVLNKTKGNHNLSLTSTNPVCFPLAPNDYHINTAATGRVQNFVYKTSDQPIITGSPSSSPTSSPSDDQESNALFAMIDYTLIVALMLLLCN